MPSHEQHVLFDVTDGILSLTLNRANKRNALSDVMLAQVLDGVEHHLAAHDIRVMVIRGDGGNFCAGRDLNDETGSQDLTPAELTQKYRGFAQQMGRFASIPVPKIALLEGYAVGAGWVLAALCDLRYATAEAQFSIPEMNLGFPFGMNGTARLVQHVGLARAAELVFSGRKFSAEEALNYGFLSNSMDLELGIDEAHTMAWRISQRPSFVVEQTVKELQDAATSLVEVDSNNVSSMVIATLDLESQKINASYSSQFTQQKESVS